MSESWGLDPNGAYDERDLEHAEAVLRSAREAKLREAMAEIQEVLDRYGLDLVPVVDIVLRQRT
ncbi:MAG: hypothetical protein ACKVWR_00110 [Acidimicrobiales bacterium]